MYYPSRSLAFAICGATLCSCTNHGKKQTEQTKPNIIYFYFDDLGYGELGCYGQSKIKTPNIDKLAQEGMRFTQHYTTFPVSAPARCGLITGKHSGHCFIRGNYEMGGFTDETEGGQMALPEGATTVADLMKQAGYTTGGIGKWGLGIVNSSGNPQLHGFDYFYGYMDQKQSHNFYPTHLWENGQRVPLNNEYFSVHGNVLPKDAPAEAFDAFIGDDYSIDRMAEKTLEFIRNNKDKPFFLYLPYTTPHLSLQCTKDAMAGYVGQFDEEPYLGNRGYTPCRYPLSTYAAMITYTDKQVGRIMDLLKELGLDENTIFMVSSDNGATFDAGGANTAFFNSTGGLRGRKQDLYEGGISIPFIARWPGKIPAGTVAEHVSVQYDLFATLEELTGVDTGWKTDGVSFLPTLLGYPEKQKKRDYLYFEFPEKSGQVAIIKDGRWKGVKSNMKSGAGTWEVFDLQADRGETTDISAQQADLVAEFEKIIKKEHWQAQVQDWEFIDPKFRRN